MNFITLFHEFKKHLNSDSNIISNEFLKKTLKAFNFIFLDKNSFVNEIDQIKESNFNIIIIDQYSESTDGGNEIKYYIICFYASLIIIEQSNLNLLQSFFDLGDGYIIFYLKDIIKQEIAKLLNSNQKLTFCEPIESTNLKEELSNFFDENPNLLITENKCFFPFLKLITRSIFGFLIRKSYTKVSNFDRIENRNEMFIKSVKKEDKKLDNFITLRQLSFGSSSIPYLVLDIEKEELFVSKSFDLNCYESEKLFDREKNDYLSIHHPFLAQFYGTLPRNDCETLLIEFINGSTLKSIPKLKLNETKKIKIILSILIVIQYLHFQNFIYRDLKPNNLMIDKNDDVVLIDFDRMIKNTEENTGFQSTHDFGHSYAAPELNISSIITEKVDIFSIGLLIYFIINEKEPKNNSMNEFKPKFLKLKELCEKCINEKPEERPTISEVIHDFIFNFLIEIYQDSSFLKTDNYLVDILEKNIEFSEKGCNDAEALYTLGLIYLKGIFVEQNIKKAFDYFLFASELNHPKAQVELGIIYTKGIDNIIKIDFDSAILYFNLASIQNYSYGYFYLGSIHFYEEFKQRENNIGLYYLNLAAKLNNSEALLNLGLLYLSENSIVDQDITKAVNYLTQAANQGQIKAQYCLGILYINGKFIKQNIVKGIHYLTLASKQRFVEARFKLGVIYYEGKITQKDINKAIDYLIFASNNNHLQAQFYLGYIYYNKKDYKEAIKYFTLVANQNDDNGQRMLGEIYFNGNGVEKDLRKSIHYFSLSAMKNNMNAINCLNFIYKVIILEYNFFTKRKKNYYELFCNKFHKEFIDYNKQLNAKNIEEAINILTQKSVNDKDASAMFALGLIYFEEIFIERDTNKALNYFIDAAKLNFVKAQYILGLIYFLGENVDKDIDKTIYYWSQASQNNYFEAQYGLICIYSNMNNKDKIYEIMNQISKQNNLQSIYKIGMICYEGKIIEKDINKAIEFWTIAANKYYSEAALKLFILYNEGKEIKQDYNKAVYYYFIALQNKKNLNELKYLSNPNNLQNAIKYFDQLIRNRIYYPYIYYAEFYLKGIYFKQNLNKVHQCFEYAKNCVQGVQYIAGMIYYEGKFLRKNINRSIYYFAEGGNFNDKNCCFQLALILFEGKDRPRDINRSIDYFLRSIDPCLDIFAFNMIRTKIDNYIYKDLLNEFEIMNSNYSIEFQNYYKNIFLTENKSEMKNSINFFMNKSFENDSNAQFIIGLIYYKGIYFNKDINKAMKFFYLSAIQNNSNSQIIFGIYLIEKQIDKAIYFLLNTKYPKRSDALFILGSIYYEGKYVKKDIQKAISYFKDASNLNNSYAKNNLGIIYLNGIDVQKDINRSIEYFKEAIRINQDDLALFNLAYLYVFEINKKNFEFKKIFDLLVEPINHNLFCAIQLLCCSICEQFKKFELKSLKKEFEKINIKLSEKLFEKLKIYLEYEYLQKLNQFCKNIHLFYVYFDGCILPFVENDKIRERLKNKINFNCKKDDINQCFYEGFGI